MMLIVVRSLLLLTVSFYNSLQNFKEETTGTPINYVANINMLLLFWVMIEQYGNLIYNLLVPDGILFYRRDMRLRLEE
jgi:hypothetical protein